MHALDEVRAFSEISEGHVFDETVNSQERKGKSQLTLLSALGLGLEMIIAPYFAFISGCQEALSFNLLYSEYVLYFKKLWYCFLEWCFL